MALRTLTESGDVVRQQMKLLFVTPFFAPQTGGVATYLEDLRRFLSQQGHEVFVLRLGEARSLRPCRVTQDSRVYELYLRDPWIAGAQVRSLIAFAIYFIPTLWMLVRFVREKRIQLISLEYPLGFVLYFLVLRALTGVKLVVGLHGDDVLSIDALPVHERRIVSRSIREADWVLAHSASLLHHTQERVGIKPGRSSVLPCGIDCQQLRMHASVLPPVAGQPFLLTVAKLYKRKGIDVLLQGLSRISDRLGTAQVLIVGDGPEREGLERSAAELGLLSIVRFVGDIPNTLVPAYFRDCQFFVLPSRSEPFGIVLLEAMTFGKAIVATRVGGIPEFVTDGEAGLLVPAEDADALAAAILCLNDDTVSRDRLGRQGLSLVDQVYDYRQLVQQYGDLYAAVLRNPDSQHAAAACTA